MRPKLWVLAGLLAAAALVMTVGTAVMAQDGAGDDDQARYLITDEQMVQVHEHAEGLIDQGMTREEARVEAQTMAREFMAANLESYGLSGEQIDGIFSKMDELEAQREDMRALATELRDQGMDRGEMRSELRPMAEHARQLRGELHDLLEEHGIEPPPMEHDRGGPGFGGPGGPGGPGPMHGGHDCPAGHMP